MPEPEDIVDDSPGSGDAGSGDTGKAGPRHAAEQPSRSKSLWRTLLVPTRAQLILALVLGLVSFALVTQIRTENEDEDYSSARREDLIQLLDQLTNETRRLEEDARRLERTKRELESGADAEEVAREEAQNRADALAILAGVAPAEGPGIRMVITDPRQAVRAVHLLNAIQEMRDAGGEVIEVNDTIRVVAGSWVAGGSQGLLIDNQLVSLPITIEVIGDPHALYEAALFRGGLVSEIKSIGGDVQLNQLEHVEITSLYTPKANQHARPQSEPPR